jgi:hypothetical protein
VPAPVEPAPAPPPPVEPAPMLTPVEPVAPPPVEAVEPAATAVAPAEDPTKKPISVNAWARLGLRLQSPTEPKKMDHLNEDGDVELHLDGQITNEIGLTANFAATFPGISTTGTTISVDHDGTVEIMDLIGRFDIDDAFHVWAGRMLVPSDRANFSGAWFAAPWYYPGFYMTAFNGLIAGPREGAYGRNDGLTIWGQAQGGLFKYYASAFELDDPTTKPLWSGRLNLSLINPEPGYYHSSTYYGGKDIFAIAIGGQMKKDGSSTATSTDDYAEFNADVLFEKDLSGSGVLDLEGAFYKYIGDGEAMKFSWFAVASYLTPDKVGPGKLQPLLRVQSSKLTAGGTGTSLDVQLGYVIADYAARLALGYEYTKVGPVKANQIYLGAQFQK